MSFFNDASIVQIPSGYKASTLYSIKPSSGAGDFSVVRATTATRVNENGLIESVAANVPRIDYLNGSCGELLVEPQRTNLFTYSEQFDNAAWLKAATGAGVAPIVTANAATAPDGTTTADRVQLDAGGATSSDRSILRQSVTTSGANDIITFYIQSNSGAGTQNLDFHFNGLNVGTITAIEGQWTRFEYSATSPGGAALMGLEVRGGATDQTADILLWGAQYETGSYATSYIPTVASTVTRNADVISKTSIASLLGDSEGALFLEASLFESTASASGAITISDGTTNNRVTLAHNSGSSAFQFAVLNGGSVQASISGGSIVAGTFYKLAARYATNDFAFYIGGSSVGTDVSGSTFSDGTLTRIGFDSGAGSSPFYGRIRQLVVFDQALTNAELTSITS